LFYYQSPFQTNLWFRYE